MRFRFLLSAPHGDIELSRKDLEQPFRISPSENHPFLSLHDYFGALQKFIMSVDGKHLHGALAKMNLQDCKKKADISEVLIRSEKHGAFYHIASIEFTGLEKKEKLAITTALAGAAKASLKEEFLLMQQLASMNPDFLPRFFYREAVTWPTDSGAEEFYMVLGEWLDDFHEWHLSLNPATKKQQIQLWDYKYNYRFLTDEESYELLRQISFILTCYYDPNSFCQIYPWHHGAGDFVVKAKAGTISVKLVTVRQYQPLVHFEQAEAPDRLVAAIHFLLNLSLRIRLDRLDGVGEPAWLGDVAVHAAVEGFFSGLGAASKINSFSIVPIEELLEILRSFDVREVCDIYESLLAFYADEDQHDFRLIKKKLADHAAELHETLQNYTLKKF
ncbi:MAG: hypothetical protein AMJ61_15505 [Desulfobacterales bacterium SG8_35_2]|nr:MAG: hypothetical protein AMJ61_15505 [Desulfobacterales bacterium SG8_35_2]